MLTDLIDSYSDEIAPPNTAYVLMLGPGEASAGLSWRDALRRSIRDWTPPDVEPQYTEDQIRALAARAHRIVVQADSHEALVMAVLGITLYRGAWADELRAALAR